MSSCGKVVQGHLGRAKAQNINISITHCGYIMLSDSSDVSGLSIGMRNVHATLHMVIYVLDQSASLANLSEELNMG